MIGIAKKSHSVLFVLFLTLGLALFGCGSDSGGSSDSNDCDGPVPCLTENWGDSEYWFKEANGNPVLVRANGTVLFVGGVTTEGYLYVFTGDPSNCYNGNLFDGAIDWNDNGDVEDSEWLSSVSGDVNICKKTLTVSNLIIEGTPEKGVVANYEGVDIYATDNDFSIHSEILLSAFLDGINRIEGSEMALPFF